MSAQFITPHQEPVRVALTAFVFAASLLVATSTAAAQAGEANLQTYLMSSMGKSPRQSADSCEVLRNGNLAVSGQSGAILPGGEQTNRIRSRLMTAIVNSRGRVRGNRTRSWVSARLPRGHKKLSSDFGPAGSYAFVSTPLRDKFATTFVVSKRGSSGRRVRRFGKRGSVTLKLPRATSSTVWSTANVLLLRDGGVLVSINRDDGLWVARFTRFGTKANWGKKGVLKLRGTSLRYGFLPTTPVTPLLETSAGGLLVAATDRPGESTTNSSLGLLALGSRGEILRSFGDQGLWGPPIAPPTTGTQTTPSQIMQVKEVENGYTVIYGSGVKYPVGSALRVYATKLTRSGAPTARSDQLDYETDISDIGFPDSRPFTVSVSPRGIIYSSLTMQFSSKRRAATWGSFVNWSGNSSMHTRAEFAYNGRFAPIDLATNRVGTNVFQCGAMNIRGTARKPWAKFRPAIAVVNAP